MELKFIKLSLCLHFNLRMCVFYMNLRNDGPAEGSGGTANQPIPSLLLVVPLSPQHVPQILLAVPLGIPYPAIVTDGSIFSPVSMMTPISRSDPP